MLYETLEEAFEDHSGPRAEEIEEWMKQNAPLDERLCYVVRTEDETPAAAKSATRSASAPPGSRSSACDPRGGEGASAKRFSSRRSTTSTRGDADGSLGVDAENETGATRLYERVGMTVTLQDDAYEKVLEPARVGGGTKLG